jgi:chemotaxis protein methyltransferase CheR
MTVQLQIEQLSDKQLAKYAELIYDTAGIRISSQKRMMLSNRLRRRLKANGLNDFDKYLELLSTLPEDSPEWDAFLQEVSTHETFLFRDEAQWNWLQNDYLPSIVQDARAGKRRKTFRVWSAASSTGDEAYSVAVCAAAAIPDAETWNIQILGTDIGIGAVRAARAAEFGERAMRLVPESFVRRFFDKQPDGKTWKAKPLLMKWLEFRQHNLLEPLKEAPFDVVFLKNVLIYFDVASKQQVLGHVLPLIAPGGKMITAAAEGVSSLIKGLEKDKAWLYSKSNK